jgi:hypothetical protein
MSTSRRKKAKQPESTIRRYEDVSIHFLGGDDEDVYLPCTVIIRPASMVLEVRGGGGAYTIVGDEYKHWFEGKNQAAGCNVDAKWSELGGVYVGIWIEEDYEYLFSFELGLPST